MGRIYKIEPDLYKKVKKDTRWHADEFVALKHGISIAKVTKIKASKNFENFEAITRAEHPPLRETTVGRQLNRLIAHFKQNGHLNDDIAAWIKTGKRNHG